MKILISLFLIFTVYCGGTVERTILEQPVTETEKTEEPKVEKTEEPKVEKTKEPKKLKKEISNTLEEYGYKKKK